MNRLDLNDITIILADNKISKRTLSEYQFTALIHFLNIDENFYDFKTKRIGYLFDDTAQHSRFIFERVCLKIPNTNTEKYVDFIIMRKENDTFNIIKNYKPSTESFEFDHDIKIIKTRSCHNALIKKIFKFNKPNKIVSSSTSNGSTSNIMTHNTRYGGHYDKSSDYYVNKYIKYKTKYLNNVHGGMLQITFDNKVFGSFPEITWNIIENNKHKILKSDDGTFIKCSGTDRSFDVVKYTVFENITIYIIVRSDKTYNIVIDDLNEFDNFNNISSLNVDYSIINDYPSGDGYYNETTEIYKDHKKKGEIHPDHSSGTCFQIHGTYSHGFWYKMTHM